MAASASQEQRLQAAMTLMTMVGSAGGRRLSAERAERALGVNSEELAEIVDELAALSVRETGTRALISLEDGYVVYRGMFDLLPAVRLTVGEGLALSAALADLALPPELARKVGEAVFGQDAREQGPSTQHTLATGSANPLVPQLIEASDIGVRCRMRYQGHADRAPRWRLIDPHEVVETSDAAYLIAWDVEKDAQRLFRIDRIAALEATDDSVEEHAYVAQSIDQGLAADGIVAEVHFRTNGAFAQAGWPGILSTAPANTGGIRARVACANESWLFDQILANPKDRILLGPPDLQKRFVTYACNLAIPQ